MNSEQQKSDPPEPPRETLTQGQLASIWREVLDCENILPDDTFLALGGESILGAQCLNRIRAVFGVELQLEMLFAQDATLANIARSIEAASKVSR